jgi:hypothetical protein
VDRLLGGRDSRDLEALPRERLPHGAADVFVILHIEDLA